MDQELLKRYLIDMNDQDLDGLIPRELELPQTDKIKVIIGPRRAGKTSLMKIKKKQLISNGISKERIIFLNLEDPRLYGMDHMDMMRTVDLHRQIFDHSSDDLHIFIDEPQNVDNWERTVRYFYEQGFDVTITGSSSKLLSKEISTHLRGRSITYLLLPFSLKEMLDLLNIEIDTKKIDSRTISKVMSTLDYYLERGGYPELFMEKNEDVVSRTLSEYIDILILRDLVDRYSIRNTNLIRWFIKSLINCYSQRFSVNKLSNTFRSNGMEVSKNTLYEYLSMLEDSMYFFVLRKYSRSVRKNRSSEGKIYVCDTALVRAVGIPSSRGRELENLVFLQMTRDLGPFQELFYYTAKGDHEIDLLKTDKGVPKELVQVSFNIRDPVTFKRETTALIKASKELNCKILSIITYDQEDILKIDDLKIDVLPFWKYALR